MKRKIFPHLEFRSRLLSRCFVCECDDERLSFDLLFLRCLLLWCFFVGVLLFDRERPIVINLLNYAIIKNTWN